MKTINFLIISLVLLFSSLFLFANNVYAWGWVNGVYIRPTYVDSYPVGSFSTDDYSMGHESPYGGFEYPSSYPDSFGYVDGNLAWKLLGSTYSQNNWVNYFQDTDYTYFTTGNSINNGYYSPGYYMAAISYYYAEQGPYGNGSYDQYYPRFTYMPILITSWNEQFRLYFEISGQKNPDDPYNYDAGDPRMHYSVYYAPIQHNGVCGSNAGVYTGSFANTTYAWCNSYPYAPKTFDNQLPVAPTAAKPTTSWVCQGTNGGADRICAMKLPVNGACNSSLNGKKVNSISQYETGIDVCSSGTATPITGDGSAERPWNWGCLGINGGTSTSATACSATIAKDGTCGTFVNGQSFSSVPSGDGLCDYGTPSAVSGGASGPWTWTCISPDASTCSGVNCGKTSATCTAYLGSSVDGVCGTSATIVTTSNSAGFSSNLCGAGNGVATAISANLNFPTAGNPTMWTCGGTGGGNSSATCTAVLCGSATDGVCGSANAQAYGLADSFPGTFSLCQTPYATSPATVTAPTTNIPATWYCLGSNGVSNQSVQCTATRVAGVDGVCGSATVPPHTAYPYTGYSDTFTSEEACSAGNVGVHYYYRVSAINAVETGALSNTAGAITPPQ